MKEIGSLSSRVELSPTSAIFTYSYSDFRGDPINVLMRHFDIMLYMANWGTRQLAFRLPRTAVNVRELSPYLVEGMIQAKVKGIHLLLDITMNDEGEGIFDGWIDGYGWLDRIAPVRQELLRGDRRLLYLAWLAATQLNSDLREVAEPPVPPNLGKLSSGLKKFAAFFEVDKDLIAAAAQRSSTAKERSRDDTAALIAALPESERNELLLRVVDGDALVGIELSRRLDELERSRGEKSSDKAGRGVSRTVAQLQQSAQEESAQRQQREQKKAHRARILALEKLGEHEEETWSRIDSLLDETRWKAHEEAVNLLVDLRDLAEHRGKPDDFLQRFSAIATANSDRQALMRRFRNAGLLP
jgi:hypothetical protein